MQETTHRGYRIRYHCTDQWFAHIYRPGAKAMMGDIPKATREEGEGMLLKRAKARIDQEEAKIEAEAKKGVEKDKKE